MKLALRFSANAVMPSRRSFYTRIVSEPWVMQCDRGKRRVEEAFLEVESLSQGQLVR